MTTDKVQLTRNALKSMGGELVRIGAASGDFTAEELGRLDEFAFVLRGAHETHKPPPDPFDPLAPSEDLTWTEYRILCRCDRPGRVEHTQVHVRADKAPASHLERRGLLARQVNSRTLYRTTKAGRAAIEAYDPEGRYERIKDGRGFWARKCGGDMHVYASGLPSRDEDKGWHVSMGGFLSLYRPRP